MPMKVLLEFHVKTDDLAASYAGIHETLIDTRAFAGNLDVEVLIDDADPGRVILVETWEESADHDAYLAWRATPEGAANALIAVVDAPLVTRTFTVGAGI